MGFSRQAHWSELPFPPPGDLPKPGTGPASPALGGGFFTTEPPREGLKYWRSITVFPTSPWGAVLGAEHEPTHAHDVCTHTCTCRCQDRTVSPWALPSPHHLHRHLTPHFLSAQANPSHPQNLRDQEEPQTQPTEAPLLAQEMPLGSFGLQIFCVM